MNIQLIKGHYITNTERQALVLMLQNGYTSAWNKPKTKVYTIVQGWIEGGCKIYKVSIKSRVRKTIGADVVTDENFFTIKVK